MKMEQQSIVVQESTTDDNELQELLRALIKKGISELRPMLDKHAIRYVTAEEAWNVDSAQAKNTIRTLEERGLLKPEPVGRALTCPKCGSPEVHSKYACPKCMSQNVEFTELLEHIKCGDIGSRASFTKGSLLTCPRCNTILTNKSADYRVIGNFFQCEKCGHRFDKPDVLHICQNCGTTSSYQEAKYIKIFSYKIADETLRGFQKELPILKNVKKALVDNGFKVQLQAKITGSSGVQCPFDVLAEKNAVRLVIDISTTGDKNDIIALLAKKVDVNPTEAIMIDLSNLDALASLGKVFGIVVFKTTIGQNLPDGFQSFLVSLSPKDKMRKATSLGGG